MCYIALAGLWICYLTLHSVLASDTVKLWSEEKFNFKGAKYRLFYTVVSIVGLAGIAWYMLELPGQLLFDPIITKYIGFIFVFPGIWIITLSFEIFSSLEFLGLKEAKREDQFIRDGIHARVRHPIYTGTILVLIGYFLISPTDLFLISVFVIFIYLPIGIYFEEKKLIRKFGNDYLEYRQEVPSIIPKLRK